MTSPASGNTLAAFTELAKKAPPPSRIPPQAPLGGLLFVKDTLIKQSNLNGGNAIDVDAILAHAPPATYAHTTTQYHTKPTPTTFSTVYGGYSSKPTCPGYPTGKPDYNEGHNGDHYDEACETDMPSY